MAGRFGSGMTAGFIGLTLVTVGCGYDKANSANDANSGNGNGYIAAPDVEARVTRASGDLTQALATFRAQLGDPSNTIVGEQGAGRREINWDAVPATLTNLSNFPGDQFNRVVPRGQVFTTEGVGFRVSDNNLADLNPAYGNEFKAFSPTKIFIAVGSPIIRVNFQVAGSTTPARTSGFGVVFSDVDVAGSTSLAFFDAQGRLLKKVNAPVRSDANGHSFVGVTFSKPVVARVRIIAGAAGITGSNRDISAGGDADLVATDDFIAGEPHPIQ
ncbi:MAG TPA: hypothetical protein VLK88_07520 [Gemmatimonadales bacterium]|nr:hypothetical protein [Gemmatimonadales bacterium]